MHDGMRYAFRTFSARKVCGFRADSTALARARSQSLPIPDPGIVRSYRPPLYNQLVQRAARAVSRFVNNTHPKTQASTIARVIHTLLAAEEFTSIADLTDALKFRLAALRIRWTNDDITTAYRLVSTARPRPGLPLSRKTCHVDREPDGTISRAEAAAILERLGIVQ
jgi:hypothetical protein